MSATDESQNLDAGWDDEDDSGPRQAGHAPDEAEVDEAWDSIAPPVASVARPSIAPATEEVDSGWDDVAEGAPEPSGKRRRHRPRRVNTGGVALSTSPVLLPRPAEPAKKQHREHSRKQRAYEAQVKAQRKLERKQQRAAEAQAEAAERLRKTQAEAQARQLRREERERAERERPKPKPAAASPKRAQARAVEVKAEVAAAPAVPLKRGVRPGVIITLLVVAAVIALLLFNK